MWVLLEIKSFHSRKSNYFYFKILLLLERAIKLQAKPHNSIVSFGNLTAFSVVKVLPFRSRKELRKLVTI